MTRNLALVRHGQSEWNLKKLFTAYYALMKMRLTVQKSHEKSVRAMTGVTTFFYTLWTKNHFFL
jgi:bisphosphoglycerate-dependent phosphoglycerate mutase